MMVSLSQVHVKGIKLNLPTGLMGQTQSRREYVALSVDKDGEIYYDKQKVDPNEVYERLAHVHRIAPNAKIFIRGDRDAYHGDILRLIEQVRAAGFYKIAFEVKSPSLPSQASP
jgi:biopolymer transport protein ExbD